MTTNPTAEAVGNKHILYKTGDADAPNSIKDSNGEVVLGLCRICGRGEVELKEPCEPNFAALACQIGFEHDEEWSELEISYGGGGRNINRERLIEIIKTLAEKMYRLGLTAQLKVEDAEVARYADNLRSTALWFRADGMFQEGDDCDKTADLLERLVGERDQARQEVEQCHAKSTCCCGDYIRGHSTYSGHEPVSMYSYALDAVEAKLAEREAELAKADAVIVKLTPLIPPQWSDNGSWTANDQAVCENAHVQHAARQQQRASAEPTERDGDG